MLLQLYLSTIVAYLNLCTHRAALDVHLIPNFAANSTRSKRQAYFVPIFCASSQKFRNRYSILRQSFFSNANTPLKLSIPVIRSLLPSTNSKLRVALIQPNFDSLLYIHRLRRYFNCILKEPRRSQNHYISEMSYTQVKEFVSRVRSNCLESLKLKQKNAKSIEIVRTPPSMLKFWNSCPK